MKTKTIILTLMLCCIAISTKAQKPGYVHKTLAQCGGDTLKYLETMVYSMAFEGRPVNEFMNKLGLPVKGVKYHLNVNDKADLTMIELIIVDVSAYQYKLQKKYRKYIYICLFVQKSGKPFRPPQSNTSSGEWPKERLSPIPERSKLGSRLSYCLNLFSAVSVSI